MADGKLTLLTNSLNGSPSEKPSPKNSIVIKDLEITKLCCVENLVWFLATVFDPYRKEDGEKN